MKAIPKIVLIITAVIYWSCETVIFPDLNPATSVLVVDAWITNKPEPQTIRLTKTQPYFENALPPGVSGAQVEIEDDEGNLYAFTESDTLAGLYVWSPAVGEVLGETGRTYTLRITAEGESYLSATRMGRVPSVDSITFRKEPGNQFISDLYLAEFWATDPVEPGDTYWIRTYKNSQLLNKPSEINLAYDAGFSRGGNLTGVVFIAPIRTGINPFDQDESGNFLSPFVVGDSLFVEIHSLSEASFDFLTQVALQTDRPGGFAELFATPLANVSTNIGNVNPSGKKAVGFFNVAAVSGLGRKFASLDDVTKRN